KKKVEPVYPPDAFAAGLTGDVTLSLDIDAGGRVTAVAIVQGARHGFDEAAAEAARQMEFTPAEGDGKPSPIRIAYTIHFKPPVGAPEPPPPEPPPPEPPPPPPPPPAAVVVRGRMREKGTRDPVVAADVAIIPRTPGAAFGEGKAEVVGATDADGL